MTDVTVSAEEQEGGASFLSHLPGIIKQRRWLVAIPAAICAVAGVVAAFVLPTEYESKATLLVEAPLLPEDMTTATGDNSGVLDQRMAKFRQQVLSRPQLIELIRQNGLYTGELRSGLLSDVIDKMRASTSIQAVSADIQQSGAGKKGAIAFSLSFTYSEPAKAQAVAQALTEQILELDATKNAAQAGNVVQFLRDQEADLQRQIVALEGQISSIKAANGLALSAGGMVGIGGGTGSYDAQIAGLQRDNQMLNRQRDLSKTSADRDPVVSNAEAQLAAARAVYSETHPDVVFAKQRLAEARRLAASNTAKLPLNEIDQQIAFNNAQISALQAARSQESARTSAAIGAQARAPVIQEQIAQLQKRLDVLNVQYQGVSARLLNARAGKKAEDEQQGERLTLIDPPVVPEEPKSPNRPLLIAGGIAAGLGLGLFLALALEFVMRPIRDADMVRALLGEAPLVVIPTISLNRQRDPWYRRIWPFRKRGSQLAAEQ